MFKRGKGLLSYFSMTQSVTELLKHLGKGDKQVLDVLIPLVYQELHGIAKGYLRREPQQTLQPTSLIHEAYLRMVGQSHPDYLDRAHFYGVAARIMRQILVDHARARGAAKRGSGEKTFSLNETLDFAPQQEPMVIALDEALGRLAETDERKARLVEMRFFGGMTAEEIEECTSIPAHTVRRELRLAHAWLHKELANER